MISLWLRSLAFNVGWYLGSTILAIVGSPILLMPRRCVVAWSLFWIDFCLGWLRVTCRLTHRVGGLENMPASPVIFACKHQSSWETLAFSKLFPNSAIVLKRELLFIPIVGWAMARVGNIAVERGDGAAALRGLVRQARAAIADGRSILIFPKWPGVIDVEVLPPILPGLGREAFMMTLRERIEGATRRLVEKVRP